MAAERTQHPELHPAYGTLIGAVSPVSLHVLIKVTITEESFVTECAGVGAFPRVRPVVCGQVSFSVESPRAISTGKCLYLGMDQHVLLQMSRFGEASLAYGTV